MNFDVSYNCRRVDIDFQIMFWCPESRLQPGVSQNVFLNIYSKFRYTSRRRIPTHRRL